MSAWTENPDGTLSCSTCNCAPFAPGRSCACAAAPVRDVAEEPIDRLPSADDYEIALFELQRDHQSLERAARRARAAARGMYHGPTRSGSIAVVDVGDDGESPRQSYECQRDSIRLRLLALDVELRSISQRRRLLENLYRSAQKREIVKAVKRDRETALILRGLQAPPTEAEGN